MDFENFRKTVCDKLGEILGKEYTVQEQNVEKLNQVTGKGICIRKKDESLCPVLYLDWLYKEYEAERFSMVEVIEKVLCMLSHSEQEKETKFDVSTLPDWEKVKSRVKARLINSEKNKELLKNLPHREFCNLSVTYYLDMGKEDDIGAGIPVNYAMVEQYGQNEDQLFRLAIKNMDDDVCFMEMGIVIRNLINDSFKNNGPVWAIDEKEEDNSGMYILTNNHTFYGAAVILSPYIRSRILDFCRNEVYILPSSIHELIIVEKKDTNTPESLCETVKEINAALLSQTEILADNVYLLGGDGEVRIVA